MKLLKTKIFGILSICLFLLVALNSSSAQSSKCDPCNDPWSLTQQKTYTNQTVQGLPPSCTFTIILYYQKRICNGIPQVKLVDYIIANETNDPNCQIYCPHVGNLMRKATKLFLQDLGGHVVVNKPASCFYTLEFDPAGQFANCIGNEINNFSNWYVARPCGNSCCVAEYELQPNGDVHTISSTADPCMGIPPSPIPATVQIVCNGITIIVPVIPPTQPLTCEPSCDNTGDIFSAKTVGVEDEKQSNEEHIFPNPAGESINIRNWKKWTDVKIYDVSGKLLLQSKTDKMTIVISTLPKGYYNMILSNDKDGGSNIQKFIKE